MKFLLVVFGWALSLSGFAAGSSEAPDAAYAYIISPTDGETVGTEVLVRFGLSGMGVAPAGVDRAETGHHHLLIDREELPAADQPMPASDTLIHFGKGQTEALIKLTPGTHSLQLVLGNHFHVPHQPMVKSKKITVQVAGEAPAEEDKPKKKGMLDGLFR